MAKDRGPSSRNREPGEWRGPGSEMQRTLFDLESPTPPPSGGTGNRRKSYARIADIHPLPRLIDVQLRSFQWFSGEGLRQLFDETFPIKSYNGKMSLELIE